MRAYKKHLNNMFYATRAAKKWEDVRIVQNFFIHPPYIYNSVHFTARIIRRTFEEMKPYLYEGRRTPMEVEYYLKKNFKPFLK